MPGIDHFNLAAPFYEHFIRPFAAPELLSLLALSPGMCVLDAAGGTGRVARILRQSGAEVVVADFSAQMLQQAHQKGRLPGVRTPAERLPFASGCFDRVLMVDALHHVCDQAATAHELYRVLRPGGRLVIEEPDIRLRAVKWLAWAEKAARMRSHFLAKNEIEALFSPLGGRISSASTRHTLWVVIEKE